MRRACLLPLLFLLPLAAQQPPAPSEPIRIGPGVIPPRPTKKIEPEFSPEARAQQIQGTVVLHLVVDERGRTTDIAVLSPLGFGLDEQAIAAVEKWEFEPGTKNGQPVKIQAIVEVNFRFQGILFDEKTERRRTSFNTAIQTLRRPNAAAGDVKLAVDSIARLTREKYPPALYITGEWRIAGDHGPRDAAEGLALISKAADRNHGPALYSLALRRIEGRDLPRDPEKGFKDMRDAAVLGSLHAQLDLGNRYEAGNGVPRDLDRARRYFRLCAARGVAACQYRLGRILFQLPARRESDYLQSIALLQLAAEQNHPEARELAAAELPKLTAEQTAWVARLKQQILQK